MAKSGAAPDEIVERLGLVQITDEGTLQAIVDQVVAGNPGPATQYREGKTNVLGFFVGQVMKATSGKANPALVNRLLQQALGGEAKT